MRGRPRTLAEWAQRVDDITLDGLNQFLRDHPPGDMTIVTIGPEELEGQE
jgi:predicted Zn-dependent peptidase